MINAGDANIDDYTNKAYEIIAPAIAEALKSPSPPPPRG